MCGRFTNSTPPAAFAKLFHAKPLPLELAPRYNIAPTNDVLACRTAPSGRELVLLHWGLIPAWAEDQKIGYRTINARAETVAVKPAFRSAFRHRRCIIGADGFFEWQRLKGRKQPYYIRLKGGRPFGFAGLWERWEPEGGKPVESCTIIVTDANALVAKIHDRMPVILPPEHYDAWLDPQLQEARTLQALLKPYAAADMEAYPVSALVNSPKNDRAELIQRSGSMPEPI